MSSRVLVQSFLEARLAAPALVWLSAASDEIAAGVPDARFMALLSSAARKLGFDARERWHLSAQERSYAAAIMEGWNPERWTALEAARFVLVH